MRTLSSNNVKFSTASVVDSAGKVFFFENRIFRAIYSEQHAELFREILNSQWINDAFEAGLVKTWVPSDLILEDAKLTLEHDFIPFALAPSECTNYMHWLSAKRMMELCLELSNHGFWLKDAHPWNMMFYKGSPVFVDFGSVEKLDTVSYSWFDEFRRYFAIPIWLGFKLKSGLSEEYRREHLTGFGLKLFDSYLFKKIAFISFNKLYDNHKKPHLFFKGIDNWLDKYKPKLENMDYWSSYTQSGDTNDPLKPVTPKHKFIYDILFQEKPKKVLDCAANKGFYSELATRLGASVISFDYEPYCVDLCLELTKKNELNITPALMNFIHPTPPSGMGLVINGAYDRFKSDIVLALGLAHHICLTQRIPVSVFCEICLNYAEYGIIFEYVDRSDLHVSQWNIDIPNDYSLEGFSIYFMKKFPNKIIHNIITEDGINRSIIYYYSKKN